MTLEQLKPVRKNGSGRYEPRATGIVMSLSGVVAAISLAGTTFISLGSYRATLDFTTDRTAAALLRQDRLERRLNKFEVELAEIKTLLNERTTRRNASLEGKKDDSI